MRPCCRVLFRDLYNAALIAGAGDQILDALLTAMDRAELLHEIRPGGFVVAGAEQLDLLAAWPLVTEEEANEVQAGALVRLDGADVLLQARRHAKDELRRALQDAEQDDAYRWAPQ